MITGRVLDTPDQIVAAAMAGRHLVGQTHYTAPDGSSVEMEYPIKCLNISEVDHFYQTDTGPVLWPDFGTGWSENAITTLRRAFIAHNSPGWAELIIETPTAANQRISVNHYSRSERLDGVSNRVVELPLKS